MCVVVGGMGCGWGLDVSAHPSATLNALWDFFSSPRVSELSLDSLRARDWELSQDLRAIFGLSESCKTLCKLDSSQRVWELFLLSEIVKALTAFRELYLNLEIISCLQESLVIVFHLEHATYVAKQTIKKLHFHLILRCKTFVNRFCFVPLILHTGGGIVRVPADMLEPIPSPGMSMK